MSYLCKFVHCDHHRLRAYLSLNKISDLFKNVFWYIIQEVCIKAAWEDPRMLSYVPDQCKTQEMCIKAAEVNPWQLDNVPDYFKMQEMCDVAVRDDTFSLQHVPDWFVTQQQIELWHDDDFNDDKLTEWYDVYEKCKTQKAKIKEELMPIA